MTEFQMVCNSEVMVSGRWSSFPAQGDYIRNDVFKRRGLPEVMKVSHLVWDISTYVRNAPVVFIYVVDPSKG